MDNYFVTRALFFGADDRTNKVDAAYESRRSELSFAV